MDGSNWSRPRTGSPAVRVVCPISRTTREEGHAEYEESRLVRFQLNMPNSWYHTRLPKGVRDSQELDVAGPDSPRAAGAAGFQLVGAQARRVLPQPALAAAGHRRMGPAAVAPRGLERATHPDLETLP